MRRPGHGHGHGYLERAGVRDNAEAAHSGAPVAFGEPFHTMAKTSSSERKATPLASGVLDYFPLALAAVARLSKKGNDKHNPGEPLHWNRGKSNDHRDCIARHLVDCGKMDEEIDELHDVALAWRALANLQLAEEKRLGLKPPL